MIKFEMSIGNNTFHEIPFKTVSYEKKDVVTCISPIFAAEHWHQIIFAADVYRRFGSFMHLYIRSVVAPIYEMIKVYEKEVNPCFYNIKTIFSEVLESRAISTI